MFFNFDISKHSNFIYLVKNRELYDKNRLLWTNNMIQLPTTYSSDSKKKDLQSRYTIPNIPDRKKTLINQTIKQTKRKKNTLK